MARTKKEKELMVAEISQMLEDSQTVILVDYRGLDVPQISELRNKLREEDVVFKVVKNSMVERAAAKVGIEGLDEFLTGPTAMAFGADDPVSPAKILKKYAKETKKLEIKAGWLDGRTASADEVNALADLPGREELISKVVGGVAAPLTGLVMVTQGPIRGLQTVLNAIKEKKEAEAA